MAKISKKKREEILAKRFPEFFKLSEDFNMALDCMLDSLEEKLTKIENIQAELEELREQKSSLDNEFPD